MTRTQWNSTLPARTQPLRRKVRPKARNAKRRGSRFPKRRDPAYCAWIRTLPCEVGASVEAFLRTPWSTLLDPVLKFGECAGPVECAHVKTRGAGGDDYGNTLPMCRRHHRQQHDLGIKSFQRLYSIDLAAIAADLATRRPWPGSPGDAA